MTLDDEPIAVQIAIQDAHGLLAFQIAHEPKFGKYGPGILIAQQFLQWAFERRLPRGARIRATLPSRRSSATARTKSRRGFSRPARGAR